MVWILVKHFCPLNKKGQYTVSKRYIYCLSVERQNLATRAQNLASRHSNLLSISPQGKKKKDQNPLVQWASESSVFLVQLLTLFVFGQVGKN